MSSQGLRPPFSLDVTARLKSCPVTNHVCSAVIQTRSSPFQTILPQLKNGLRVARPRAIACTFQNGKARIFRKICVGGGKCAGIEFRAARGLDSARVHAIEAQSDSGTIYIRRCFACHAKSISQSGGELRMRSHANGVAQNAHLSARAYCTTVVQVLV
jgi:hypothetical protein